MGKKWYQSWTFYGALGGAITSGAQAYGSFHAGDNAQGTTALMAVWGFITAWFIRKGQGTEIE